MICLPQKRDNCSQLKLPGTSPKMASLVPGETKPFHVGFWQEKMHLISSKILLCTRFIEIPLSHMLAFVTQQLMPNLALVLLPWQPETTSPANFRFLESVRCLFYRPGNGG